MFDRVLKKIVIEKGKFEPKTNQPASLSELGGMALERYELEHTNKELFIHEITDDLRSAIYGDTWNKEGTNDFFINIESAIDSIKRYHEVDIVFDLKGNIELLSVEHKKAFYRIINEGIRNAIHYGNAKHINIELSIEVDDIVLKIDDDGNGFDTNLMQSSKIGMGIKNMNLLTQFLHGNISLSSCLGRGTIVIISVPSIFIISQM